MEEHDVLKDEFINVLKSKAIKTVFQPIISLRDGSVFGYEALSRGPENTRMYSPDMLFGCAKKYNLLWDLEWLCRITAIETVLKINLRQKIFLNVNPKIISDVKFKQGFTKEYLSQYRLDPEQIIFEITEKGVVNDFKDFIKTVENYKEQNFKIAIDDAGAGYSGLNMITDINPHYIKLDMHLIRDIDKDFIRQSLIRSFTEFASLTNTSLIAEGIESKSELIKLIELGVHYGQGFYLARPSPEITPLNHDVVETIVDANAKRNHFTARKASDLFISNIAASQLTFRPNIKTSQVFEFFINDPSISGVCVTENERVLGVVTRNELFRRLSGQYGYTLYSNKPISAVMNGVFLQVDANESIETVAKKAMSRGYENLYDFITVTKEGKYYGIVTIKDLLDKSYQAELYNAIHLNPLSQLPGNVLIEKELEKCIGSPYEYTLLYFDINNFKAYNDVYGFENGDRLLKHFTRILQRNISQERYFIGHIGGDDFISIVFDTDVKQLCSNIINEFDGDVPLFYSQDDLKRGYVIAKNRHGIDEVFPVLSLSIAITLSGRHSSVLSLSEHMAELKKLCKQRPGSNYIEG